MNRSVYVALMVVAGLGLGVLNVAGVESANLVADANKSIEAAGNAVEEARVAIENGKQFVAMIPEDSAVYGEVLGILKEIKGNWVLAVSALDSAKTSASKISSATSAEIANDYKLLATVNASVAMSGAKVVQTGILFMDAAAHDRSESLGIIRKAMQDSLASAEQVRFYYERVKNLIAEKYSK